MGEFIIDSEDFSEEDKRRLSRALAPVADADVPLVVELALVGEEEIQALNRGFRKIDRVTDVLSFPALDLAAGKSIGKADYPVETEEGALLLGSVAICKKRAEEQAAEYGHSYARELTYLAVHGVLHCLGYDHEREEDKKIMREREESVMRALSLARE